VVETLENGEQPTVFLDLSGQGIQVAGADVAGCGTPLLESSPSSAHGRVDICISALGDVGECLAIGWINGAKSQRTRHKSTVDEMSESTLMTGEPVEGRLRGLGRRPPGHAFEHFSDSCHALAIEAHESRHRMMVRRGVAAAGVVP